MTDMLSALDFEPQCEAQAPGTASHPATIYLRCRNQACRHTYLLCDRALADARAHSVDPRYGARREARCCGAAVPVGPLEEVYEIGSLKMSQKPPR